MGKKVNYRATQLRSQKIAAERKRQDEEKRAAFWAAHGKHVKIAVIAAAVLAVAIWLISWWAGMNALPTEIRDLNAIEDNWIVIDTDSTAAKRYHHPATYTIPEGYVKSEFATFDDGIQQSFLVEAESPDAPVSSVNVFGAANWSAEQYIQRVVEMSGSALNEGTTVEVGEPFSTTVAGKAAKCVYLSYTTTTGDETKAYGCLYVGFDAPKNVCVYAVLSGAYTTPENVQTADILLSEAETLLAGLTIIE